MLERPVVRFPGHVKFFIMLKINSFPCAHSHLPKDFQFTQIFQSRLKTKDLGKYFLFAISRASNLVEVALSQELLTHIAFYSSLIVSVSLPWINILSTCLQKVAQIVTGTLYAD